MTVTPTPDAQTTVNPGTLEISSTNWNTPQTVTVTAVDDTDVEGAHTVTITDDDTAGVTVTPTSGLETTEAGGTAQFVWC